MNIIKTAVKRGVTVAMIFIAVIVLGFVAITNIGMDLFPSMNLPMAVVFTDYSNASSEEVETNVTAPLEAVLSTVTGLDSISSTSSAGMSMIMLSMNWGTDMDFAALDIREKIDMIEGYFPDDVGTPTVMNIDMDMMPILYIGVTGGSDLYELKSIVEETIEPALERIDGIASVDVSGGYEQEIQVVVDPVKMEGYGLTTDTIAQLLAANNLNMSAGTITDSDENISIQVVGKFESIDDIRNLTILTATGATIFLNDIATISEVSTDSDFYAWFNGEEGIYLSISKESDANTVNAIDAVNEALEELMAEIPAGITVETMFDQGEMIEMVIASLAQSVIFGSLFAMLVLYFFFRSIRATLIIGASIPISLMFAFVLMYFTDMTFNLLSLGGLALGVGMMVDSSIVILENIQRLRAKGMASDEAATQGASQLVMAVFASTLTTVAVFLPIAFTDGLSSIIFTDLALSVSFSLIASLVVAILLIPMLSARVLENDKSLEKEQKPNRLYEGLVRGYKRVLEWALDHRISVIGIVVALFIGSIGLISIVGMEFIPSMDGGQIDIDITLDDGTKIDETVEIALLVEDRMENLGDIVESVYVIVGESGTNSATVSLQLIDKSERDVSNEAAAELARLQLTDIAGVEFSIAAVDSSGMSSISSSSGASYTIYGDDMDTLEALAEQVKAVMENVEGAREISSSVDSGTPEIQLSINSARATQYGITVASVASTVANYYNGTVATTLSVSDGDDLDVRVILPEENRDELSDLLSSKVSTSMGYVTLGDLVTATEGESSITISREDQTRTVTVSCTAVDVDINSLVNEIDAGIANIALPSGYSIEVTGTYEEMIEAFESLALALVLSVILVYMIMASLFESLIQPFIIMFTIPTTFIGVFLGLYLAGITLNVASFMGIIMLMGIVVNNGIVLVDYINSLKEEGFSTRDAITTAGPIRLRPILMTTLTTVLAMVPLAFTDSEGSEMTMALGVTVAAGLIASTVFTLVFVPVIYSLFGGAIDKQQAKRAARKQRKADRDAEQSGRVINAITGEVTYVNVEDIESETGGEKDES